MLRELKTFFAEKGSKLLSESEQKVRAAMKEAAATYETGTVKYKNKDIAFVRCIDPMKQLTAVLRAHAENGNLRQRSAVSGTELRLLCVGDKGGRYTKLMLCILDVVDPLSPNNGVFLGMYEAGEKYELVSKVFSTIFSQLATMQSAPINISPSKPPPPAVVSTSAQRNHSRESSPLPGDPHKTVMRADFHYRSPDCRRCKRLTRDGVRMTAPFTDTPYQSIVLLYGGDIPWLSLLLGISKLGRHFCTSCLIAESVDTEATLPMGEAHALIPLDPHRDVHHSDSFTQYPPRTCDTATADYSRFVAAGADVSKVKLYNNQLHQPIIQTDFNPTPSPLHLTIGHCQHAFDLFYAAARSLDAPILKSGVVGASNAVLESLYHSERELWVQLDTLRESIDHHTSTLDQTNQQINELTGTTHKWEKSELKRLKSTLKPTQQSLDRDRDSAVKLEKKLESIEQRILSSLGPFCTSIEVLMNSLYIKRQSFHGGSFKGNDCHRIFENRGLFASLLRPTNFPLPNGPTQSFGSHTTAQLFTTLFDKLHQCDELYSVARPLCCHELRALELRCASFGNWFPHRFPAAPIKPKFHLLTKHVPLFAARWQTVGLASEQAIESSNRIVNRLDRMYATLTDSQQRLSAMIQQLVLESNPAVRLITRRARLCTSCSLPIVSRFPIRCQCKPRANHCSACHLPLSKRLRMRCMCKM